MNAWHVAVRRLGGAALACDDGPHVGSHTTCVWPLAQQRSVGGRKASLLALVDSRFQLGTQSASCSNCSAAPDCRADQIAKILHAGLSECCSGLADSSREDHDSWARHGSIPRVFFVIFFASQDSRTRTRTRASQFPPRNLHVPSSQLPDVSQLDCLPIGFLGFPIGEQNHWADSPRWA